MSREPLQTKGKKAIPPEELLQAFTGTKKQREKWKKHFRKEELNRFIEIANLLPASQHAADLDEIIGGSEDRSYASEDEFLLWIEKFKLLIVYLERFPPHFREYVLEDSRTSLAQINIDDLTGDASIKHVSKIYGALIRYDDFRKVREKLKELIRLTQVSTKPQSRALRLADFFHRRIPVQAGLHIEMDGTVNISLDPFADAINGVDATRIRECNECQRIFWANRKDQSCCSKDCANRYHVRRHREKYASDPIAHKLRRLDKEEKRSAKKGK